MFSVIMSVGFSYCYAECFYAECRYTECRGAVKNRISQPITLMIPSYQTGGNLIKIFPTKVRLSHSKLERSPLKII
jgi:hypothetical protein